MQKINSFFTRIDFLIIIYIILFNFIFCVRIANAREVRNTIGIDVVLTLTEMCNACNDVPFENGRAAKPMACVIACGALEKLGCIDVYEKQSGAFGYAPSMKDIIGSGF